MKTELRVICSVAILSFAGCGSPSARVSDGDKHNGSPAPARLKIEEVKIGAGPLADPGKTIAIHYTGYLANGVKFDTTVNREPLRFRLGSGMVINGWEQGIAGMRTGGKRHLVIPPELAYGSRSLGSVPANATLIFDVELISVN